MYWIGIIWKVLCEIPRRVRMEMEIQNRLKKNCSEFDDHVIQ